MKIAIIGRSQILLNTAYLLSKKGYDIRVVITAPTAPEYSRDQNDFKNMADELGVPFFLGDLDIPELIKACRGLDLGISLNWPKIIADKHIRLFRLGILNAHYSDLPKYRGNACLNWAILQGEGDITVSLHFMEGGRLDCGRIINQKKCVLDENGTITEILTWCEKIIPNLFLEGLERIAADENFILKYVSENDENSFRCYPRLPEDGFIDWIRPVKELHALIRAAGPPYPGAYTYHNVQGEVKKLIILTSRIIQFDSKDLAVPGHIIKNDRKTGESWVRCGDGVLSIGKCRYENEGDTFQPGKRWKSIRMRLGIRPEDWLYLSQQKRK
jgi:methionyl-tRNA formyltransferase